MEQKYTQRVATPEAWTYNVYRTGMEQKYTQRVATPEGFRVE
jgi:hypothetical protein